MVDGHTYGMGIDATPPKLVESLPDSSRALIWSWPQPMESLSSAPVGGGIEHVGWAVNAHVALDYSRIDLAAHAAEISSALGLVGAGATLLTAAEVRNYGSATIDGVRADATVGATKPTWAADPGGGFTQWTPGTINLVVQMPVAVTLAAAVNLVIGVTEAKTQALIEASVPGTGTASDAVLIVWPRPSRDEGIEHFGGVRSEWGSKAALAAHRAVGSSLAKGATNGWRYRL